MQDWRNEEIHYEILLATNMRALICLRWIIVCQMITSFVRSKDYYEEKIYKDQRSIEDLQKNDYQSLSLKFLSPSWNVDELFRRKRNGEATETESVPTRHAKHRKRRRCRNRSTCLRGIFTTDSSFNETKNNEKPRERSNTRDQAQEFFEETKSIDYETGEEKSTIETKGRNFALEEETTSVNEDFLDPEPTDSYDDAPSSVEGDSVKSRSKDGEIYPGEIRVPSVYSSVDERVTIHESLSVLLSKLFQSLRNASTPNDQDIFREFNFLNDSNEDPCQKWLNSKDKLEQVFLGGLASLPACPCEYPSNIFYDDKIWDEGRERYFRWRDVSGASQRLDVYKPGAAYCVRSLLTQGSGSAAAQHCCYDRRRKLLTRGSGAGTPNFVSPEISPILHERIDVLPWRLCKGDFSRYNGVRPPNNDNKCEANPDDEEYQRQIYDTKYY